MSRSWTARQTWMISVVVCAAAVTLSFAWLDVPIARWVLQNLGFMAGIGSGVGSAAILALEAATAIALVLTRLARGHLSPLGEALALACLTSMCAHAVNDGVLKLLFGVPNPQRVLLHAADHTLHLLSGSQDSSFPSGHMILAASFAGVFMKLYPSSIWPLSALLLLGAILLVLGEWHFTSDVIAGTFAGVSAGVLAGELWRAHSG